MSVRRSHAQLLHSSKFKIPYECILLGAFSGSIINTQPSDTRRRRPVRKAIMYLSVLTLLALLASPLLTSPMEAGPSKPSSPARIPGLPNPQPEPEAYSEWMCFTQKYSPRPLRTVYHADCAEALKQIEIDDKRAAPLVFSRKAGYTLPHPINVRSCSILLDINDKTPDKTVTLPMMIVISAIRMILENCVASGPPPIWGLGGFTEIHSPDESGGILDIVLVGKFVPPEDPPPFPPGSMNSVIYKPSR